MPIFRTIEDKKSTRRGFIPSLVPRGSFNADKWVWRSKDRRPVPGEIGYLLGQLGYPVNLDAGEHFMRLRTGIDYFPYPPRVGAMQEFLAQYDMIVWQQMYRKAAVGPMLNSQVGMAGISIPQANLQWQLAVPGLTKQA